jgi:D-lyxose ketol-isomerase
MRRSEVNRLQREALDLFGAFRFSLPRWATWRNADWRDHPDTAAYCRAHQMGWDVTDFGSGDFLRRGLLVFCIRNGLQSAPQEKGYAEKLLVVRENQETPLHSHRVKLEDIIVRGGGSLVLEFFNNDGDGGRLDTPVTVLVDGERTVLSAGEPLRLRPGQSVTVPRGLWHRFYAEAGTGTSLVGEVSQVNDDVTDNYFLEPLGRFAAIEPDEAALHPLWSELPVPVG